jgi:3-deoxy-7-phosphoheptulonate synthase
MLKTDNLNIESCTRLPSPAELKRDYPLSAKAADVVVTTRASIDNIMTRRDSRLLVLVGPCSIHDHDECMEYARRLKALSDEVSDRLLLVMRAYFEKPRTVLGWKGLIYDPDLDDSGKIEKGLRLARRILLELAEMGLPTGTEILEPIIPQYITDLISWAAIGARTAESQIHRQLASGLSMPIGFKNATDGGMQVAIQAIKAANAAHSFIGINSDGQAGIFRTRGNAYGHLVLRGGGELPNFGSEYIAFARELMCKAGLLPNIVVDCSHANSNKQPQKQALVFEDVLVQLRGGTKEIVGVMLESYLQTGNQPIVSNRCDLKPGISITDACLGWNETEVLIRQAHQSLG